MKIIRPQENFAEKEIVFKILEAKIYPDKKEKLKKLFNVTTG